MVRGVRRSAMLFDGWQAWGSSRVGLPQQRRSPHSSHTCSLARAASATCPSYSKFGPPEIVPGSSPFPWPWANRPSSAIWRDLAGILGNQKASRKLAAILAADISGYGALMGADEETTVRDLNSHQAVVLPMITEHSGRVIDTAGDGILAEFASAVNAALDIQKTMAERNAAVIRPRAVPYRREPGRCGLR